MKNLFLLILFCLPLQIMAQQSETRKLDPFTEISSSASIKVNLVKGNAPEASVKTDGELEDVLTEVSDGKLKISRKPNEGWFNVSMNSDDVEVTVYFQEIEGLKVSSSSTMDAKDPIEANQLAIEVSSSGKLSLVANVKSADIRVSSSGRLKAKIEADQLTSKVSSSGTINLSGNANRFDASASSSGDIEGDSFTCSVAHLSTSSSGAINLSIDDEVNARASSSGKIRYKGTPKLVSVNTSSGGKVSAMN